MKLLFAPIAITPTKSLTPSHVKALLWADVALRATSRIHEVHALANRRTFDASNQVVAFWSFLDEFGVDLASLPPDDAAYDARVTELYVEQHRLRYVPTPERIRVYRDRIENEGFVHPISARLLSIWTDQLEWLGARLPSLHASERLSASVDEVLQRLADLDATLDLRGQGGAVFLDATDRGLPLRRLSDGPGDLNYVLCALRELLPIAHDYDAVLLAFDREAESDYVLISEVLKRAGAKPVRLRLDRVPVDGTIQSARSGAHGLYALDRFRRELADYEPEAARLGMRLYFIAHLGRTASESLSLPLLHRFVRRAASILEQPDVFESSDEVDAMLEGFARSTVCVDPYRVTSALMDSGRRGAVARSLASEVFV